MSESTQSFIPTSDTTGMRLDRFLTGQLPDISRSRMQQLITEGHVFCLGKSITDCSYHVKLTDRFEVKIPAPIPSHMQELNIPLDIIFEDEHLLVINKPAGLTVHPGSGNRNETLVNALLYHFKDRLSAIGGIERPGIVHRLDKETSGLMLIAKQDQAHLRLSEMIAKRQVKRHYQTLCWGIPHPLQGTIDAPIGRHPQHRTKMTVTKKNARSATTHYQVTSIFGQNLASLVTCQLETGRTHQIRVHFAHIHHPIIGDPTYGGRNAGRNLVKRSPALDEYLQHFKRQALHAYYLGFHHPITRKYMEYQVEMPKDMQQLQVLLNHLPSLPS